MHVFTVEELQVALFNIAREHQKKKKQATEENGNLGHYFIHIDNPVKAIECYSKQLDIAEELRDKKAIGRAHGNIGNVYNKIGQYQKAVECYRKQLEIAEEMRDKGGIGSAHGNMGNAYDNLGQYQKAIDCYSKYLEIAEELGNKAAMGGAHANMGNAYLNIGQYQKSIDCHRKDLEIAEELGDTKAIGRAHANMGNAYNNIGQYQKAIDCHRKALDIAEKFEDKGVVGGAYANMGNDYRDLGQYQKAIDCHCKDLKIAEELGDKRGIGRASGNLGNAYNSIGQYHKAIDYHCKFLEIAEELRDKGGMGTAHACLGNTYNNIGQYRKAVDCYRKFLDISEELGDKGSVGRAYEYIGNAYNNIGQQHKAIDYYCKYLEIAEELGDKGGIGRAHAFMGVAYNNIGEYQKAIACCCKDLEIAEELGDKEAVGKAHGNMGCAYLGIGQNLSAVTCFLKFLAIAEEIGSIRLKAIAQFRLGLCHQGDNDRLASSFFAKSVLSFHSIRRSSIYQDEFNMSLSNTFAKGHKYLLESLLNLKQVKAALLLSDGGKAKALYDLTRRGVDVVMDSALEKNFIIPIQEISDDPCSKTAEAFLDVALSEVIHLMQDGSILSYTFDRQQLHAWVISKNGVFHKQWQTTNGMSAKTYLKTVNDGLRESLMRSMPRNVSFTPEWYCSQESDVNDQLIKFAVFGQKDKQEHNFTRDLENRVENLTRINNAREAQNCDPNMLDVKILKERYNLDSPTPRQYNVRSPGKSFEENVDDAERVIGWYSLEILNSTHSRIRKETDYRGDPPDQDSSIDSYLEKQYSVYISPIEEYLVGSKILVVPEGSLFKTPFCALLNSKKECLCDRYSLQFTPSLHVLNSSLSKPVPELGPALFVGNPIVGEVKFGEQLINLQNLPNATVEAKECSKYFNSEALLENRATKKNVMMNMKDASIIHIAAHGHPHYADIFLAPNEGAPEPPNEDDYLLTANDVVNCTLKARLVVLSCCHSARGQISAEGVVGIARSFLGAGARSVLVTLWQILDKPTMEFMKQFYDKVCQGLSVCVALQRTMIEFKKKKYSMAVWAYFQIVGEDITLSKDEVKEIRRQSSMRKTNCVDDAKSHDKGQTNSVEMNNSDMDDYGHSTNKEQPLKEEEL